MGKLILCSGARTTKPYTFTRNGIRIYSMEELCYYLYHHVHLIEEEMISEELIDFIERELKLSERAEKLRILKRQDSDLKTMVTFILCSADYYSEQEIKGLLRLLDEVIGMPMIKRSVIKADCYLKEKQYEQAMSEYRSIIHSPQAPELTPEEYGDVYHNFAVAKVHITGLKEASKLFEKAYELNHREESFKQYLYTLCLMNKDQEYSARMEDELLDKNLDEIIRNFLEEQEKNSNAMPALQQIDQLRALKNRGKMNEFYHGINELINLWKEKVRIS